MKETNSLFCKSQTARERARANAAKPWPKAIRGYCGIMAGYYDTRCVHAGQCATVSVATFRYDDAKFYLELASVYESRRNKWLQRAGLRAPPI